MGLMDMFKKKDDASKDAPSENPAAVDSASGGDMKKCEKCGKEVPASEGNMVLEGTAFCCNECCPKDGDKEHEVCEFC